MQIEQTLFTTSQGWSRLTQTSLGDEAQLVLLFGETSLIKDIKRIGELRFNYPNARIFGCSTAGEIVDAQVKESCLVATAIHFDATRFEIVNETIHDIQQSEQVGHTLAAKLAREGLVHVFVLSDGLNVNGSALIKGLHDKLPSGVTVTGGLSADMDRFSETLVLCDGEPASHVVGLLGLYGDKLQVGSGSFGGWDPFGPERLVTRSHDNILYELDGKSALGIYKTYLGSHAEELPASALLFPLCIRTPEGTSRLVRTILSVNETDQSMIFAGDIPEGAYARFMKANINRIVDGAMEAARMSQQASENQPPELAILISCIGRKMVLKQRVEEETEAVQDIIGNQAILTGFYSYGEIAPSDCGQPSELHNQTMTITTFREY